MNPPMLTKYGFRIRTRIGLVVDKLTIQGRDHDEAQRKLRQMYRDCEILECNTLSGSVFNAVTAARCEDIRRMIAR